MHHVSCRDFWQNIKSPRWLSPPIDQIWCPATSGISQEISEHQWDSGIYGETANGDSNKGFCSVLNSRRDSGRTDWGPKVPTLKGTEASLSYVQCFLYLVSSSINFCFSQYMAGYFLDRPCIYVYPYTNKVVLTHSSLIRSRTCDECRNQRVPNNEAFFLAEHNRGSYEF